MNGLHERLVVLTSLLFFAPAALTQKAPNSPDHPWATPSDWKPGAGARTTPAFPPDPAKIYTLAELVDLAEKNNPATRVAWENAKARAADLGVARASLYPTVAAIAVAQSDRNNIFFSPNYYRQTTATFSPAVALDYVIFDFGRRQLGISIEKSNLLAANFLFNDTHRQVIFRVMQAYYQLLDSKGLQSAAEANLKNAQTVQEAAEARLEHGLATLPDVLEARSAEAQADYDLQAAIGAVEIAHGNLATALGVSPASGFQVESIQDLPLPQELNETVEASIDRALSERPDLMQQVAVLRAAKSEVKSAKTAYLPTLSIDGNAGLAKTYGSQDQAPGIYSQNQEFWNARLSLTWSVFDGWARENRVARAKANQKQASAQVDAIRDQVENQVWAAYSTARTALRQQKAAAALLDAAGASYNAALQSYNYGVRSQIDVVAAQRALASARTADVTARTQLLTGIAALAFQTGDLLHAKAP
jgi:outer membrane protein TolC